MRDLKKFKIKLAEKYFEIFPMHDYICEYCKDYIADGNFPAVQIKILQSDIDYEREKSAREDIKEGIDIRNFTDDYLETLAVYRKIAEELINYDTILFHGSVIAVDGEGYLFTAKSGTGKSTHTRLWKSYFGERAIMVNDDKPLITIGEKIIIHGTPWDGKHRVSNNISVPLKTICVIERAEENSIEKISKNDVYPLLVQQTHRTLGKDNMIKTMQLIDKLMEIVPVYKLHCNISTEAVNTAWSGMN